MHKGKKLLRWIRTLFILGFVCCGVLSTKVCCKAEAVITLHEFKDGKETEKEYTKKQFLKANKCSKEKPVIQYYDDKKQLQTEVYYNASAKKGCGIRYYEDHAAGFVISGIADADQYQHNPYALEPENETALGDVLASMKASKEVSKVKKTKKYNKAGKLVRYTVTGILSEEEEKVQLADIKFTYSKKGKLLKKETAYYYMLYGTSNSYDVYYYNKYEQLAYRDGYITHGNVEWYYCYENSKSAEPQYILCLDCMQDLIDANLSITE